MTDLDIEIHKYYPNEDKNTIYLFEIIGSFFTDTFFNHIYMNARIKVSRNSSLMDEYVKKLQLYIIGIKNNQKCYINVFNQLHMYYNTVTNQSTTMSEFINIIINACIPPSFINQMNNSNKQELVSNIICDLVSNLAVYISSPNIIKHIVIDHTTYAEDTIRILQDYSIHILVNKKINILNKFLKETGEVEVSNNSGEMVIGFKKIIKKLLYERNELIEQITELNDQLKKAEETDQKMRKLVHLLQTYIKQEVNKRNINSDKTKLYSDRPRPDSDRPRPDIDRPRPDIDRPRPDSDRPRSDSDRPRPDSDRPRPDSDRPRPDSDRPRPDSDRPRPDSVDTDKPRPDKPRQDKPRPDKPRSDKPRQDNVDIDKSRSDIDILRQDNVDIDKSRSDIDILRQVNVDIDKSRSDIDILRQDQVDIDKSRSDTDNPRSDTDDPRSDTDGPDVNRNKSKSNINIINSDIHSEIDAEIQALINSELMNTGKKHVNPRMQKLDIDEEDSDEEDESDEDE